MIYKLTKQKELPSGSPGPKYLQLFQRMDPGSIPKAQDPSRHAGELVPWSSSVHLGPGNRQPNVNPDVPRNPRRVGILPTSSWMVEPTNPFETY